MGIHQLTNVPTKDSKIEIRPIVDGETIKIVAAERHAAPNDYSVMTTTFIGNHMMEKPELLREMYARDLATVIQYARDAGYRQAQIDICRALGLPR